MEENELLNAMFDYVDAGWSIVPLVGKQPPQGFQWGKYREQKATYDDIDKWVDDYAKVMTGVGLITGYKESVCVLDLEAGENPERFNLPPTVMARSGGGGWHYYFEIPDDLESTELPTIDLRKYGIIGELRADKTYTTMPPSIHPNGNKYEWVVPLDFEKLAPLPKQFIELANKNKWEQKDWGEIMQGATEGNRHFSMVSITGKLLHNFRESEWNTLVLPMLIAWNREKNNPPLPEQEILSIYQSLTRKEGANRQNKENELHTQTDSTHSSKRNLLTVSSILEMPESDRPKFLVDMIVPEKGITALSGHPGCGKSWFMLHMAHCIATGERFLGQLKTEKGNVLIVDEESGVWEIRRRMKLLNYPENIPIYFFCQSGFKVDKQKDLDELLNVVSDNNIKLVVIDPFVAIHSGVENNAEEAQMVMEKLQKFNEIGASVLFIHHHRKGGFGSGGQSLRGSSAFSGRLDSHITIEKTDETETTTTLNVEHVKSRRGKNLSQFRVILTQENQSSPISLIYDEGISGREIKKDQARRMIIELLSQEEMTTDDIIQEIRNDSEIGSRNILQALKDLETDKVISAERDGKKKKYSLIKVCEDHTEVIDS